MTLHLKSVVEFRENLSNCTNQRVGKVDDPVALPACFHRHKEEHPSEALSVRQGVHLIDTLRAVASAARTIFHLWGAEMKDFWRPI